MTIKAPLKFCEDSALLHDHTAAASIQHRGPLKFFNPQKLTSGDCIQLAISFLQQTSLHAKFKNLFGLSAQATPQTPGFNLVAQVSGNELMHIINGNTTSVLLLDYLIPPPMPIQISRQTLLQYRISPPPGLPQPLLPITTMTTPPSFDRPQAVRFRNKRTGSRRRRVDDSGESHFCKIRKSRSHRKQRFRIHRNLQNSNFPADATISASKRHAGSPSGANEERPHHREVSMVPCRGPANGAIAAGHTAAGAGKPNSTCRRGRTPF